MTCAPTVCSTTFATLVACTVNVVGGTVFSCGIVVVAGTVVAVTVVAAAPPPLAELLVAIVIEVLVPDTELWIQGMSKAAC